MSHVVSVSLQIRSLDDLQAACQKLGLDYDRNATYWRSFYSTARVGFERGVYQSVIPVERFGMSDAGVIKVPGAEYDIACYKVPGKPGEYCLIYDEFVDGNGIESSCGKGLVKLKERYGAVVASRQLRLQGYTVKESWHPVTNRLRLEATRYA